MFEVHFGTDEFRSGLAIWFVEKKNGEVFVGQQTNIVMSKVDESASRVPPTLQVPAEYEDAFIEGIKKYFDTKGIRANEELKLEGKVVAQEKHLEDMRKIVFDSNIFDKTILITENKNEK